MLVNGVQCEVIVDGKNATEYAPEELTATHKTCHIVAKGGKRFSFKVDMGLFPPTSPALDWGFNVVIWVDGTMVENVMLGGSNERAYHIKRASFLKSRGEDDSTFLYQKMRFADFKPVNHISPNAKEAKDKEYISALGSLEVQVSLYFNDMSPSFEERFLHDTKFVTYQSEARDSDEDEDINADSSSIEGDDSLGSNDEDPDVTEEADRGLIHEKSVKGRGLTHITEFTGSKIIKEVELEKCGPLIATFIFKYYSREHLIDMDIIPEDGDVEEMSVEELQEEVKALRALKRRSSRNPTERPSKVQVKREGSGQRGKIKDEEMVDPTED